MFRSIGVAVLLALATSGCGSDDELPSGAQLVTDVSALRFGQDVGEGTYVGTSTFNALQIENGGTAALMISAVELGGASAFSYELPPETGLPITVASRQRTFLQVRFQPTAAGVVEGTLTLTSNAKTPRTVIALSGHGVAAP